MNEEEKILDEIKKVSEQVEKFKKLAGEKADKAAFDEAVKKLDELKASLKDLTAEKFAEAIKTVNESLAKVSKQMEEMAEDVAKAKENGTKGKNARKTFGQMVTDKLKEMGVTSKMAKTDRKNFELEGVTINKVVGDMTTANVSAVGTNAIPYELADFERGLTRIVKRSPWILQIANTSPTSKMYVQWAEQANQDGAANETAEGVAKNQIDFDWVEKSKKVEKITAYIKASKESLDDLDGLRNEIDTELIEEVLLKTDTDLLSGDGTTPTIAGILSMDTAYSAGNFAGTIVDPSFADVLRTAIAQVVAAHFRPNYILMHPNDVAKMDLVKSADDGHYVLPPFRSADGMVISGVRILENTGQTEDKFTVGDFSKLNVRIRENVTIDVGYDGNDFTENMITILAEIRLASYIKTNHAGAFVSGDFSDAITSLTAS